MSGLMQVSQCSFADEIVESFVYSSKDKIIELYFDSYYYGENYIEEPCKLIIKDWDRAVSKLHGDRAYDSLESNLGVVSMILSIVIEGENLEIVAHTLDDRYIELMFSNSKTAVRGIKPA